MENIGKSGHKEGVVFIEKKRLGSSASMDPWKKITETPFRAGFRRMVKKVFLLPDGKEEIFDLNDMGHVACVLALTHDEKAILVRQYRPGPEKILLELPGGMIEEGERPIEAMERELLEETGYQGALEYVGMCLDDAYSTTERHCFVARNCIKKQEPKTDASEFVEVVEMPLEAFRQHLRTGLLTDVEVGYLALDFLGKL